MKVLYYLYFIHKFILWDGLDFMRFIRFVFLFLMVCLFFAPSADAWTWKTHSDIVDAVYYGLPSNVQQKLDLNIMRDASKVPDEKFKDFVDHSYPRSYDKAKSWLDQGKAAYDRGDYGNASYDYGVASHYISDTFSAPHCVSGESSADHSKYEDQAKTLKPKATYVSGDLKTLMENGFNQGKTSWSDWLQSKSSTVIQNNLNMGASAALSATKDSINSNNSSQQPLNNNITSVNTSSNDNTTPTNENPPSSPLVLIALLGVVILAIIAIIGYKALK